MRPALERRSHRAHDSAVVRAFCARIAARASPGHGSRPDPRGRSYSGGYGGLAADIGLPYGEHHIRGDRPALVGALDAQAASAGVRRLRAWAHDTLAVRPGERALDIGAGTGSETQVLATAVTGGGTATGVEPNPGLRAVAGQRAAAAGSSARFVAGEAGALPLADGVVDVVWCERVFQHLTEPDRAAAEIARVLRPGGRVALLDTDWATTILHPGDPDVVAVLTGGALSTAANPYAGRRLAGQLAAAGLEIDDLGSQALIQDHRKAGWPVIRMLGETAVKRELITGQQRDRLYADLTAAAERSALHMSVTMFGVVAHRPR